MKLRQGKLKVSKWELDYVHAQQAVNRVQLYRPTYPFPLALALGEGSEFMERFAWAVRQRAYERALEQQRAEWAR